MKFRKRIIILKKINVILPTEISSNIEIAYIDELQSKFDNLTIPHIISSSNQNQYDWIANFFNVYEHLSKPPFNNLELSFCKLLLLIMYIMINIKI